MGLLTARFRDYSDEYSTLTVHVDDQDGADVWTQVTGWAQGLETALEGLSIATLVSIHYRQGAIAEDDTRPASAFAQRETGLRMFYSDDVDGAKYNITVPAPDLTAVAQEGTDDVPLSVTEVAALVTWMQANMLSPQGNAITVDRAVIVGRNS